jgi:predicted RNA-binding Zn ribbon-like protein
VTTSLQSQNFKSLGGHPSLDYVNTVGAWVVDPKQKGSRKETVLREKLSGYADLVAWGQYSHLLTDTEAKQLLRSASQQPKSAGNVFKRALNLRAALYRLFKAVVQQRQSDPLDIRNLNDELLIARNHQILTSTRSKLAWSWTTFDSDLDRMLWPLTVYAAELLAAADLSRLRQCRGEECGWFFMDVSRNRSRQWCEMRDCGNLAKVKRYRQRKRKAPSKVQG